MIWLLMIEAKITIVTPTKKKEPPAMYLPFFNCNLPTKHDLA